jgi:tripartite-type tricarboxylate transporter receptor subunit TctC
VPALPKVPTLAQAGVGGMESAMIWFGVAAPKRTPPEVIARLNQDILAVVRSTDFARALEDQGIFVIAEPTAKFTQRVQADTVAITKLAERLKLSLDD